MTTTEHATTAPETDYHGEYDLLRRAVNQMADMFYGIYDGSVWPAMSCTEVESVADVMRAVGRPEVADAIVADHADEDDEGDMHHPDYEAGE